MCNRKCDSEILTAADYRFYFIARHFLNERLAASLGVTARAQEASMITIIIR